MKSNYSANTISDVDYFTVNGCELQQSLQLQEKYEKNIVRAFKRFCQI